MQRGGFSKDLGAAQIPDFVGSCFQSSQKIFQILPSFPNKKLKKKKNGIPSPRNVRLATGSLCLSRFSRLGSWEALWSRQRSMAGIGKAGMGKAGMGIRSLIPFPPPFPGPALPGTGTPLEGLGKKPGSAGIGGRWEGRELGINPRDSGILGVPGMGNESLGFGDAPRPEHDPASWKSQGWGMKSWDFRNAENPKDAQTPGLGDAGNCRDEA